MNNTSNIDKNRQLLAFFDEVYQAYQNAASSDCCSVDRYFSVGGYPIQLCFAGPALIQSITPALIHLDAETDREPALRVCLWDSESTNVKMPSPPWKEEDYLARGMIRGFGDGRIQVAYHLGNFILSILDLERSLGIFWIRDASKVMYGDRASPLRAILHWWMRENARQMLHAAAIGTPEGGVLIPGKSGSGKSTVALACVLSGLQFLGDDHVLIDDANPPIAYSLYNSAKLHPDHLGAFPELSSIMNNNSDTGAEKAVIHLYPQFPTRVCKQIEIKQILIPEITGSLTSEICNSTVAESLRALAPSTLFQLAGSHSGDFQAIVEVVKKVPIFKLKLGTDLYQVPTLIEKSIANISIAPL